MWLWVAVDTAHRWHGYLAIYCLMLSDGRQLFRNRKWLMMWEKLWSRIIKLERNSFQCLIFLKGSQVRVLDSFPWGVHLISSDDVAIVGSRQESVTVKQMGWSMVPLSTLKAQTRALSVDFPWRGQVKEPGHGGKTEFLKLEVLCVPRENILERIHDRRDS